MPGISRRVGSFALAFAIALAIIPASALGAKDRPKDSAQGLEDWEHDFDISKLPPGEYNIVVQGKDVAGNASIAGPINVYVDPKSDLPIVSVINPSPLLRVGGDLNIVGTCVDDDAVARVEVSLDGGEFQAAQGTDFWSLYVKTKDMSDGRKTVAVRGVDVNGVVGPVVKVSYDLDRSKPLAQVSSPAQGALVAGSVELSGSVFDLNGVASLEASVDGGKTFSKLALRKGKDASRPAFSLRVDTRKFPDGPRVIWLKSVDGVGSKGRAAFLLFVDNTKPSIEIARPLAKSSVHGKFTVAGAVRDAIGVARLTYELNNGDKGEIPLTPGNPYFAREFDSRSVKGDRAELAFMATDRIGNVTRLALSLKIDRAADKPVLHLAYPKAQGVIRPGERLWGSIADDDGGAFVRLSVDGGKEAEFPSSDVFSLALPALSSGRHILLLKAVDAAGVVGDAVSLPVLVDLGPGALSFTRASDGKGAGKGPVAGTPYLPGLEFRVDSGLSLEGSYESGNPPASASYSVSGSAPRKLELAKAGSGSAYSFKITLDRSMPYGFVPIEVKVIDALGGVTSGKALLYSTNLGIAREETGFDFDGPRIGEGGRITLPASEPLLGAFYREELDSIRLEPETDIVAASFEGRVVKLAAAREGVTAPTMVIGRTKRGHEFKAGPYVFACDEKPPLVTIESPEEGAWQKGGFSVTGRIVDSGGLADVALLIGPGSSPRKIAVGADGRFSLAIAPGELAEGPSFIEVDARDAAGNVGKALRCFGFDKTPPAINFLSPRSGSTVTGSEDVAALVSDASGIASVEYAADGKTFAPIERQGGAFIHRADLQANPSAAYRVTDLAGNAAVGRPEVSVSAPIPRKAAADSVEVEPQGDEGRLELSGSSGARKLSLLLPSMGQAALDGLSPSAEPEALPARYGKLLLLSGSVSLKGSLKSPAPVASVELSLDGGASYAPLFKAKDAQSAKAEVSLALSFDSSKLKSGESRILLKASGVDGSLSYAPIYALVDNAPPLASILYPASATAMAAGPVPLVVELGDSGGAGIASAELSIGAEKRALALDSGGSFFAAFVDPQVAAKAGPVAVSLSVRDAAGNVAGAQAKLSYDAAADTPKLDLSGPLAAAASQPGAQTSTPRLGADSVIYGGASDDDGAPELRVSLDSGAATVFKSGSFALALSSLSAGRHTVAIEAADSGGRRASVKKEILVAGPAPSIASLACGPAGSQTAWVPGMDLVLDKGALFSGELSAPNGLSSIEYRLDGGAPQKASLTKTPAGAATQGFSIPLPQLPAGRVTVDITARDLSGLETSRRCVLHSVLPQSPAAPAADDAEALRIFDGRVAEREGGSLVILRPGDRLVGRWNGRPLASATLEPESPLAALSMDGASVTLEAKGVGYSGPQSYAIRLVTVDGDKASWGPFALAVSESAPALRLDLPADYSWNRGSFTVAGLAEDPTGLSSLTVSINGSDPVAVPMAAGGAAPVAVAAASSKGAVSAPAPTSYPFKAELPFGAAEDGAVRLEFTARSAVGRETRVERFINKDTVAPTFAQILPAEEEPVNGTTTFVASASDSGHVDKVDFIPAKGAPAEEVSGLATFSHTIDLSRLSFPLGEGSGFVATDRAGNSAVFAPKALVDLEKDKPVVDIQAPEELEVLRADFSISGAVYDDDGVAALDYRLDGGEWKKIEVTNASFSIPMSLAESADNEHLVEAYAEDIYGVKGEVVSRRYRISKEEPTALMSAPPLDKPSRGLVEISGSAADANGVASVRLSFDNVSSYELASGAEAWRYALDTRILKDGLHPIAVKPLDKYDTEGFYASILNVDNTPPVAEISLPLDGASCAGSLAVSGRVYDNLKLAGARIEIAPVGKDKPPLISVELGSARVVRKSIDISALAPGDYAVRLVARDSADNESLASRDIKVSAARPDDKVELLFPVEGDSSCGRLKVSGRATIFGGASAVTILVDGADSGSAPLSPLGYFSFEVPPEKLADGSHAIGARAVNGEGKAIEARAARIDWKAEGPWLSIDSLSAGSYLSYRPWLSGSSGWAMPGPDPKDKAAVDAYRKGAASRRVVKVAVSLDNGKSYREAQGTERWRFRLETQDYAEGGIHLIVRASFGDGSVAVAKTILSLDKTPPEVKIVEPAENGRFNGIIHSVGTASDSSGLASVDLSIRKGDKRGYELPGFIQGLYLDGHVFGGTEWETGLGLTFFNDNVKLQASYGQMPETVDGERQRFYGDVLSAKLIANVLFLPFASFLGPDWDFLSTSLGVGAQFSYFSMGDNTDQGISAIIGQIEFPKVSLKQLAFMKEYSLYFEEQLWFIASESQPEFRPVSTLGVRVGLF
jgi:hypothetical protein